MFDSIIVGSGFAGSVLAERLASQDANGLAILLGYPTMLHSHAAAKALAAKGEATALRIVQRSIVSDDPDARLSSLP